MGNTSRGSLPQNFLDSRVNPLIRLPTPQPQFLFAQAALGGRMMSAALDAGMQTVQQFGSMAGGGTVVPPDLDRLIRTADAFPNFVTARDEFGKGEGDTIKMDREIYEGGGYTEAARERVTGKPTSTTGQSIRGEQVPMVLKHFRGPYAANGTTVQPYPIEEFDAKFRANREQLAGKISRHLAYDRVKWLDTVIRDRMRATQYITYADGVSNVLSYTAGAGHTIDLEWVLTGRKALTDREWRPFPNGFYLYLVPTSFRIQMVDDTRFVQLSKAHQTPVNPLFGFIGMIEDVMIAECTTLKTYAAGETVPGDGNAVPSGATVYESLMFGPGVVGYGTGQEAEARFSDDTDYGATAKVIWDSKEAFQTLDERGCQRILFQA
jgi:hypothetical protein